jgi:hypothetical protein
MKKQSPQPGIIPQRTRDGAAVAVPEEKEKTAPLEIWGAVHG